MIIFLYGPDSYRRAQKQKEIIAEYRKKHPGFDTGVFDSDEKGSLDRCKDFIKNRSLFDSFKLARVAGLEMFETKEDIEWLKEILAMEGVILLITSDDTPKKEFSFLIKKPVVSQEFKLLTGLEFKRFVEGAVKDRSMKLGETQLRDLATEYRNDMWGLLTELDKLALASELQVSSLQYKPDFFTMVKTVAYGRGAQKITALEELLNSDDPGKVFNILAALVSGDKKIQMADYDVAIKSGKLDYEAALLDFALGA